MRVYRSDVVSLKSAEARPPPRSVHRLDEPTGLSVSLVASPQCRFRFARQDHSSAAATGAANFRVARDPEPSMSSFLLATGLARPGSLCRLALLGKIVVRLPPQLT